MTTRGLALIEWMLLGAALLVLLALALPTYGHSKRHAKLEACRGHLQAMHRAQAGAPKDPAALGMRYWTRLDGLDAASLRCPFVAAELQRPCDYLGPRADPAGLDAAQPLGCDMEENHGEHGRMGGNVLYVSGEVRTLHPMPPGTIGDPWREAVRTKCGP